MELIDGLLRRHRNLEAIREPYLKLWEEATDFTLGNRGPWDITVEEGTRERKRLFNTHANWALKLEANSVIGNMMSPSTPFFRLRPSDLTVWRSPGVADYCEAVESAIYAHLARSRFYHQAIEFAKDLFSIGHGVQYIGESTKKQPLYSTRHPREIFLALGPDDEVDTVNRVFMESLGNLARTFGKETIPQELQSTLETNPFYRVKVLHSVFPREVRDYSSWLPTSRPWASFTILMDTRTVLHEGGYDMFPYAVARLDTNSGDTYASSPAIDCLADIKMLNQMSRTRIDVAQKVSDPPFNVPQSLDGDPELVPHGYNYYARVNEIVTPVPIGANYPIAVDNEDRVVATINKHFNVEMFLMLQQNTGRMTAREVMERAAEKGAALTPIVSAITTGHMIPALQRTFGIMLKNGNLPPPPKMLMDAGGLSIDFVGPLYQAQKRALEGEGVLMSIEVLRALAEMNPDVMDNANFDNLYRRAMDATLMPQDVNREEPEVRKIREAKAAAIQQQMEREAQAQQSEMLMRNMDRLNKQRKPNSILSQMEEQMAAVQ